VTLEDEGGLKAGEKSLVVGEERFSLSRVPARADGEAIVGD